MKNTKKPCSDAENTCFHQVTNSIVAACLDVLVQNRAAAACTACFRRATRENTRARSACTTRLRMLELAKHERFATTQAPESPRISATHHDRTRVSTCAVNICAHCAKLPTRAHERETHAVQRNRTILKQLAAHPAQLRTRAREVRSTEVGLRPGTAAMHPNSVPQHQRRTAIGASAQTGMARGVARDGPDGACK